MTNDPEGKVWESFYVLAQHWKSDLKFYNDELRFLKSLIDKYFIWLLEDKNIKNTRIVANKLTQLNKRCSELDQKVRNHKKHLAALIENPFPHNAQEYKDEHLTLESSLSEFLKDFRKAKNEVFRLTKQVIESEKANHLLGR